MKVIEYIVYCFIENAMENQIVRLVLPNNKCENYGVVIRPRCPTPTFRVINPNTRAVPAGPRARSVRRVDSLLLC